MAKMKGAIKVNTERCKGCSLCVIAVDGKVKWMTERIGAPADWFKVKTVAAE